MEIPLGHLLEWHGNTTRTLAGVAWKYCPQLYGSDFLHFDQVLKFCSMVYFSHEVITLVELSHTLHNCGNEN